MNFVSPAENQRDGSADRWAPARLAFVFGAAAFTGCGLAIISALCWFLVPPVPHDAAFMARYSVYDGFFYAHQPAKTLAFQLCVIAAPFLVFAGIWLTKRMVMRRDADTLRRWLRAALAFHLVLFAVCIRPLVYDPHPPAWLPPSWLLCPLPFPPPVPAWAWIVSVLLGFVFCWVVVAGFPRGPLRRFVVVVLAGFAIACAPVEFYAPSQVAEHDTAFSYHFNVMLDSVSQSMNGHHLLVDFPHIYGGYGEMLALVLRFFPRTMAVPLIALALPTLLAVWFWLIAAGRLIRNPAVLALGGVALLGVNYLAALPPNYCYGTPRAFFPSLGLLIVISYLRRPTATLFWTMSVLAAVSSVWNLDTGLVLWFAWTLTLFAGDLAVRAWKAAAFHFLAQIALLAIAWTAFLFYLRVASGHALDFGLLLYFQDMVVRSGYFCIALVAPSAWSFVVLLYVTGLVVAALAHARRRLPWKGRVVLFIALLGTGMFSYYMGRSAESNLISIAPPGILLVSLFADGALARIRRGLLPPITRWFILPWVMMIFWWALLFFVHLPLILKREGRLLLDSFPLQPNFVQVNARFAERYIVPGENDAYFLSGNSGFYYYLTGTVRPLRIPGNAELLQMRDMNVLIDALTARRIPKLFAEVNFWSMDMYRSDVYAAITNAIANNYHPVALSRGGLVLYVPKTATPPSGP